MGVILIDLMFVMGAAPAEARPRGGSANMRHVANLHYGPGQK